MRSRIPRSGPPVSPRRNARAAAPRAPVYRSAARGRTRALGQHFLRDRTVVDSILELVRPTGRDLVVEIGPGRGALTEALAARAGRLLALEIDAALSAALQERFAGAGSVEIRQAAARLFDHAGLRAGAPDPAGRVLVVGNLPYSVGKPILAALVESGGARHAVAPLLRQRDAPLRAAPPRASPYGRLPRPPPH